VGLSKEVRIFDVGYTPPTLTQNHTINNIEGRHFLVYFPNGQLFLAAAQDGAELNLKIINSQTYTDSIIIKTGHKDKVHDCCVSSDGNFMISASKDHTIIVWDCLTLQKKCTLKHGDDVLSCCIASDNRHIFSVSNDRRLRLWKVGHNPTVIADIKSQAELVNCCLSQNANMLATCNVDGSVMIYYLDYSNLGNRNSAIPHVAPPIPYQADPVNLAELPPAYASRILDNVPIVENDNITKRQLARVKQLNVKLEQDLQQLKTQYNNLEQELKREKDTKLEFEKKYKYLLGDALPNKFNEIEVLEITLKGTVQKIEHKKHEILEKQAEEIKKQRQCLICKDKDKSVAFVPCAHLCVCEVCAQAVNECPICHQAVQQKMKIVM